MNEALAYVVYYVLHLVTVMFIARFALQACRADFYNPISQGIVRVTDPVLKPLRMGVPGYRNLDLASLVAALAAQVLLTFALAAISSAYPGTLLTVTANAVITVVLFMVKGMWWSILIVIVASFIAPGSTHPALSLLAQITEPLLAPARRLLPAMGGLDFSPIILFLIIGVLERILPQLYL